MATKQFRVRFIYLDGRKPYSNKLEPMKTEEAIYRFRTIANRLAQENENGVARIQLKIGNKIIVDTARLARPSRHYVVKEKDNTSFALEGRQWAVGIPNSERLVRHYATEEEARAEAAKRNVERGVDKIPQG